MRVVDEDVAVGRLGVDLAARVGDADAFVDRGRLDAAAGLVDGDHAFDRSQRDRAVTTGNFRVAMNGFDGDFRLRAFDRRVEIRAREVHRHPSRHRDLVVDEAAGTAAAGRALRADPQRVVGGLGADRFARAVRRLDAHAVLIPRAHHDLAGLVAQDEARAFRDVNRLLRAGTDLRSARPRLDRLLRIDRAVTRLRECRRAERERDRGQPEGDADST